MHPSSKYTSGKAVCLFLLLVAGLREELLEDVDGDVDEVVAAPGVASAAVRGAVQAHRVALVRRRRRLGLLGGLSPGFLQTRVLLRVPAVSAAKTRNRNEGVDNNVITTERCFTQERNFATQGRTYRSVEVAK
ncbi:hypothetical protein ISCGN_008555 [Ixodes scapularis]